MRQFAFSFVIVVLAIIFSTAQALSASGTESLGRIAGWAVYASYSDDDGAFLRCIAVQPVQGHRGRVLSFSIRNDSRLEIMISDKNWRMEKGASYDFAYQIDRNQRYEGTFRTRSETLGYFVAAHAEDVFQQLRKGNRLYVLTRETTLTFGLKGTARALTAIRECWDRRSPPEESTDPFADDRRADRAEPPRDDRRRTEAPEREADRADAREDQEPTYNLAIGMALAVVSDLSDQGFHAFDGIPDEMRGIDADMVWETPGGFGLANLVPVEANLQTVEIMVRSRHKKECEGKFATQAYERPLPGLQDTRVVKMACTADESGDPYFAIHAFYPMSEQRMVLISHYSADPDEAIDADRIFHRRLTRMAEERSH